MPRVIFIGRPGGVVSVGSLASKAEPSWGRVLADTVKLTVGRRWPARRYWRPAALVLALAATGLVVLGLTGVLPGTVARTGPGPAAGPGPLSPQARVQAQAATWVASQVSDSATVACYPPMCAVLQEHGVVAGRLIPLRSTAASPLGAPPASARGAFPLRLRPSR